MDKELRKLLKVPKEQRIAQYIYNTFRDYEQTLSVYANNGHEVYEKEAQGIDIFYVEDDEFIKRFNE